MEFTEKVCSILQSCSQTETQQLSRLLGDKTLEERKEIINTPLPSLKGRTSVHIAAQLGLSDCLEMLLINGGNPNVTSYLADMHQTPLHLAASNGKVKSLELLLGHKADPTLGNVLWQKAEFLAQGKKMCETIFVRHRMKTQMPSRNKTEENYAKELHQLIESKEDTEKFIESYQQLHQKRDHKYTDLATRWLDEPKMTLLYRACDKSNDKVVEIMLQCSSSTPLHNLETFDTPLLTACKHENKKIAKLLLDHSPQLLFMQDAQSFSAFHYACVNFSDNEMMHFLLENLIKYLRNRRHVILKIFSLDIKSNDGYTPLLLACFHNSTVIVKCLLEYVRMHQDLIALDVNAKENVNERTSLHFAMEHGNEEIITLLLGTQNLDVNVIAKPSKKALNCLASKHASSSTEQQLVTKHDIVYEVCKETVNDCGECMQKEAQFKRKIEVGHKEESGDPQISLRLTPLAEACMYGNRNIINILRDNGACDDETYRQLCQITILSQNTELLQWLLTHKFLKLKESRQSSEPNNEIILEWHSRNLTLCGGSWFDRQTAYQVPHLTEKVDYKAVTVVRLNDNHLNAVPDELFALPSVEEINLTFNEISALPLNNWSCKSLKKLHISHNLLTTIPAQVWMLENLQMIDGHCNCISELNVPQVVNELSKTLCEVDLSLNKLKQFYEFILHLEGICYLNFGHNSIKSLPPSLWLCTSLKKLILSHNNISSLCTIASSGTLRADSTKCIVEKSTAKSSLKDLCLDNNEFVVFPEELPCLTPNLHNLDISNNTFKYVDIRFIPKSVTVLTAKNCSIEWIGNTLDVTAYSMVKQHCFSTRLGQCEHRNHEQLSNLNFLYLQGNQLTYFQLVWRPPLAENENFETRNEFRYNPSVTTQKLLYPFLTTLNLANNMLEGCLNPNVGHQTRLSKLTLSGNTGLTDLPMELSHLEKHQDPRFLVQLEVNDLPSLIEPPLAICKGKTCELIHYMKKKLKKSKEYRSMKLFFIGNSEAGKSTLLHRLRGESKHKITKTFGIDILEWECTKRNSDKDPINFILWDVSGQESYRVNNQWFYSQKSLYVAVFRLSDGEEGVKGLEPWLKNVKLHAPGCFVIVIGTHLDKVSLQEAKSLEDTVKATYQGSAYPKVVEVASVNCVQRLFNATVNRTRNMIYDVAYHLVIRNPKIGFEYERDETAKDFHSKALLKQMVPNCFLKLQQAVTKKLAVCRDENLLPVIREDSFRESFRDFFQNDEEMDLAVDFLSFQGSLLHFKDVQLQDLYFLDAEWLGKVMAYMMQSEAIQDGEMALDALYSHKDFETLVPQSFLDDYINLLETFGVALKDVKHPIILVPSLLPDIRPYPSVKKADDDWPSLTRFWLSTEIPDGFWPKLICRVVCDQQIENEFRRLTASEAQACVLKHRLLKDEEREHHCVLLVPWKTGIAYTYKDKTLIVVKQEIDASEPSQLRSGFHWSKYRIHLHIYVHEWISMIDDLKKDIPGLHHSDIATSTTHIVVILSQYIKSLLSLNDETEIETYAPCWKCYTSIYDLSTDNPPESEDQIYLFINGKPLPCYLVEPSLKLAMDDKDFDCPNHGKLSMEDVMPDLVFRDMNLFDDQHSILQIYEDKSLGKGGYGYVSIGDLIHKETGYKTAVAVKVYCMDLQKAYENIRQEIKILKPLESPFLVKLCGVRTQPRLCMLLELAPMGSLRDILKSYQEQGFMLEPLTQKCTALQVAKGLTYLHGYKIAHLDMKSPNILVWCFPFEENETNNTRPMRIRQAGNVWVKLTDYGTSQFSGKLTIRVNSSTIGTLGYTSPEVYERKGQEISSEKVDVFAYGMVLYEILTLRLPFDNVTQLEIVGKVVRNGRPELNERLLVLLKQIMKKCWKQDPLCRPKMSQVSQWIESHEVDRVRAKLKLDMNFSFCACVCRIASNSHKEQKMKVRKDICSVDMEQNEFSKSNSDLESVSTRQNIKHVESDANPHTQIWIYGRKLESNEGHFQILSYFDGYRGYRSRTHTYSSADKITAICSVRNQVWIGSTTGDLQVLDASTLSICHNKKLRKGDDDRECNSPILHIEYIQEENVVLVSTANAMIFSLRDELDPNGDLMVEESFGLQKHCPCYHMVKVINDREKAIEVWGPTDNNSIHILVRGDNCWRVTTFSVRSRSEMQFSRIIHTYFTSGDGQSKMSHVWLSYRNSSDIISIDANTQEKRDAIDCNQHLRDVGCPRSIHVSSMLGCEKRIFVGTSCGKVGIFDSETATFLSVLCLHVDNVQYLLPLPRETEACICQEMPLKDNNNAVAETVMAKAINPYFCPNPEPNAVMITSIGKGHKFMVDQSSPAEHTAISVQQATLPQNDITMLIWRSSHNI